MVVSGLCVSVAIGDDGFEAPASYYSNVNGTGSVLKSQLGSAMAAGHIQRNYDNIRDMARFTDVDPNNSSNILLAYNRQSMNGA